MCFDMSKKCMWHFSFSRLELRPCKNECPITGDDPHVGAAEEADRVDTEQCHTRPKNHSSRIRSVAQRTTSQKIKMCVWELKEKKMGGRRGRGAVNSVAIAACS